MMTMNNKLTNSVVLVAAGLTSIGLTGCGSKNTSDKCSDVKCGEGQECNSDGKCVDKKKSPDGNKCPDTPCPEGQECQSDGTCVDKKSPGPSPGNNPGACGPMKDYADEFDAWTRSSNIGEGPPNLYFNTFLNNDCMTCIVEKNGLNADVITGVQIWNEQQYKKYRNDLEKVQTLINQVLDGQHLDTVQNCDGPTPEQMQRIFSVWKLHFDFKDGNKHDPFDRSVEKKDASVGTAEHL